jgi:hypothetical protein
VTEGRRRPLRNSLAKNLRAESWQVGLSAGFSSVANFKAASTLAFDDDLAVRQAQFDLSNMAASRIGLFGDQCCALRISARFALRNVAASV